MLEQAPAPPPTWPIPIEVVKHLATATAWAFLIRAKERGATFRPQALLTIRSGRFVAQVDFVHPIGPEKQDGLVLMLAAAPEQNR